jgi:hypothetical protein
MASSTTPQKNYLLPGRIVAGMGTAHRNLPRQLRLIAKEFPEIAGCHPGTLNVLLPVPVILVSPDHRTLPIKWHPESVPEVFEFLRIRLGLPHLEKLVPAWLYVAQKSPHRRNLRLHEVIAPQVDLKGESSCRLSVPLRGVKLGGQAVRQAPA